MQKIPEWIAYGKVEYFLVKLLFHFGVHIVIAHACSMNTHHHCVTTESVLLAALTVG